MNQQNQSNPFIPTLDELRRQANRDNNSLLARLIGFYDAGYFRSYEDWLAFALSRMTAQATEYLAMAVRTEMLKPPPGMTIPAELLQGESQFAGRHAAQVTAEMFHKQLTGDRPSG